MISKAVIVEDEKKAAEGLVAQLGRIAPQIEVVAVASTVENAFEAISTHAPQLLFLDIELKDGTGFDLLERFGELPFAVIFTTAYNGYAIQAFRFAAVDYLLKPIFSEELQAALQRFEERSSEALGRSAKVWQQNQSLPDLDRKLAVPEVQGIHYLRVGDLLRLEAESNYCKLWLKGGASVLSTRGLKAYEELLEPYGFFRCHKSHVVNLRSVVRFLRGKRPSVEMEDGASVAVARQVRDELLERLARISL